RRIRIAVAADDPVIVDNLTGGTSPAGDAFVAVTGADVVTLRSLQLKGRVVAVGPPDDGDRALADQHADVFTRKIEATDGHPREGMLRFLPTDLVMVDIVVDEAFDQTPGPGAGAILREQWS